MPFNAVIPLLVFTQIKTLILKDICALMFIIALLTIVEIQKHPKYPSVDECTEDVGCMCVMEYYSATKNEILSFETRIDLESIMLSKINQF